MAHPKGLLPLPYLDAKEILADEGNRAEFRRLKDAGHVVYVRKLSDGTYEIVDGGITDAGREYLAERRRKESPASAEA